LSFCVCVCMVHARDQVYRNAKKAWSIRYYNVRKIIVEEKTASEILTAYRTNQITPFSSRHASCHIIKYNFISI
jgi:hypothetical protein